MPAISNQGLSAPNTALGQSEVDGEQDIDN